MLLTLRGPQRFERVQLSGLPSTPGTGSVRWCTAARSGWSSGTSRREAGRPSSGVLLEPMITPTLWTAVAQARPSARFIRGVVLEVTLCGWSAAARSGASRVPDLGQVPELDPGIMALGLEPMIALPVSIGSRADQQVRTASGDAQSPGAYLPRAGPDSGEGESRPVPAPPVAQVRPVSVALGFGPGTAVADGVSLLVGHRHAPRRRRVGGGSGRPGRGPATGRSARSRRSLPAGRPAWSGWPAGRSG